MSRTGGSATGSLVKSDLIGALPPVGYLDRSEGVMLAKKFILWSVVVLTGLLLLGYLALRVPLPWGPR